MFKLFLIKLIQIKYFKVSYNMKITEVIAAVSITFKAST